jgi:hypothetical protein
MNRILGGGKMTNTKGIYTEGACSLHILHNQLILNILFVTFFR